jgi:hypothetical protein
MKRNVHKREKDVSWTMAMTPPPFKQAVNIYTETKMKKNQCNTGKKHKCHEKKSCITKHVRPRNKLHR